MHETINFVGAGNTFAVNGTTIDVSISSGSASIMTVGVRVGTAVTFVNSFHKRHWRCWKIRHS